jgi:hypothetical protein
MRSESLNKRKDILRSSERVNKAEIMQDTKKVAPPTNKDTDNRAGCNAESNKAEEN